MSRKASISHPGQHPSVLQRLVEQVGGEGKTVVVERLEDQPLSYRGACSFKQSFIRYRNSLKHIVNVKGDTKYEVLMHQAMSVATKVEALKTYANGKVEPCKFCSASLKLCDACNGKGNLPQPDGRLTFYNRELTPFAKSMEAALRQTEVCE